MSHRPGELPVKDARIEKFCQEISNDASVSAAYELAGYNPHYAYRDGSKLLARPYVHDRITWLCRLQGKAFPNTPAKKTPRRAASDEDEGFKGRPSRTAPIDPDSIDLSEITPEWVLRQALVSYHTAAAQSAVAPMVKMLELIGRLSGVDKRPNGRPANKKDPNKGDVSNDKSQPDNPIDFASLVAGYGGSGDGLGDDTSQEDAADADAEGGAD